MSREYQPGQGSAIEDAAKRLAGDIFTDEPFDFDEQSNGLLKWMVRVAADGLKARIPEGVDHQGVLDSLVGILAQAPNEDAHMIAEMHLLASIQAMYEHGCGSLLLDLRGWEDMDLGYLTASAERPLALQASGEFGEFGEGVAHCDMTLVGTARRVGTKARSSVFHLKPSEETVIGSYAMDCVFYLYGTRSQVRQMLADSFAYGEYDDDEAMHQFLGSNEVYYRRGGSWKRWT